MLKVTLQFCWQSSFVSLAVLLPFTISFPTSLLLQDGGLLINNPTALAIHECKCLWPNTPLQCVLSLGTGRYETAGNNSTTYTSLKAKLTNVISSATDTEGKTTQNVVWMRLTSHTQLFINHRLEACGHRQSIEI